MSYYNQYRSLMLKHPDLEHLNHKEKMGVITKSWHNRDPEDITGAGLFDFVSRVAGVAKKAIGKFTGIPTTVRLDWSPSIRDFLQKFGGWRILKIFVMKQPLAGAVKTLTNIISLGQFNKILKTRPDDLFHIFMRVIIISPDGQGTQDFILEKNQVIQLNPFSANDRKNAVIFPIQIPETLTLKGFMDAGKASTDPNNFFQYDPLTKNCGQWIEIMMKANGLMRMNPDLEKFLFQDTKTLNEGLSSFTKKALTGITDLAGWGDRLIYGSALDF